MGPDHPYRSHSCAALRADDAGRMARLAGWLHRKRDHGHLLFADLRDHYGITQLVATRGTPAFRALDDLRPESVLSVTGRVVERARDARNPKLATGDIELIAEEVLVHSPAVALPFAVADEVEPPEDLRLRYRFVDLRRPMMQERVLLRARIVASLREKMRAAGFCEITTPILTASSPEGARDFLVPSRVHPGEFYALPQAPQQFKQLLMVAGFDRYFQIAPCFRDEAARADRSPGEFYQLDCELAFATQDDVFAALEPVLFETFAEHTRGEVTAPPFPRIRYTDAIERYGSDKPDLRNPLVWRDVSGAFAGGPFRAFAEPLARGAVVRALRAPGAGGRPRRFFDGQIARAQELGARGLAWLAVEHTPPGGLRGPLARFVDTDTERQIRELSAAEPGDAIFFVCDEPGALAPVVAALRGEIAAALDCVESGSFRFAWIVDYPMFERDPGTGAIGFSHNPFSMPQGGLAALGADDPCEVLAWQYDLVCNGVELSSGAVRNHRADIMHAAFAVAGYTAEQVESRFGGMLRAFRCGAPPHAGIAPGVDRILMLIAEAPSLREIIAFPLGQNARDAMMGAPSPASAEQLRELGLRHTGESGLAAKVS